MALTKSSRNPSVPEAKPEFPYPLDDSRDTTKTENGVPTMVPIDFPRIGTIFRNLPRFADYSVEIPGFRRDKEPDI